jgi:hypothetical protein
VVFFPDNAPVISEFMPKTDFCRFCGPFFPLKRTLAPQKYLLDQRDIALK